MSTLLKVDIEVEIIQHTGSKISSRLLEKCSSITSAPLWPGIFNKISYFWVEVALKQNFYLAYNI